MQSYSCSYFHWERFIKKKNQLKSNRILQISRHTAYCIIYILVDQFCRFGHFFMIFFFYSLPYLDFKEQIIPIFFHLLSAELAIGILEAKHDKPSPRTRTTVTGVLWAQVEEIQLFFPSSSLLYARRLQQV